MGRLEHLKHTLPENIRDTEGFEAEFILINYSSPDSCEEWIQENFDKEIRTNKLVYYRYDGASKFHHSHAKNLAHRVASGEILCNVDADNFIGKGFGQYLLESFAAQPGCFIRSLPRKECFGRLAFLKADFFRLGGYDERMNSGWGYEDWDLMDRAKLIGLREKFIDEPKFVRFIGHDDFERVKHSTQKVKEDSDNEHRRLSFISIQEGCFVANEGLKWGSGRLSKNFHHEIIV
jgi:hypothetical protein